MRQATKLIAATGAAAGAVAVLVTVRAGPVDVGADLVLLASLVGLAHTVFHIVDDPGQEPVDRAERGRRGRGQPTR